MATEKTNATVETVQEEHRTRKRVSDILRDGRLAKDQELQDVSDKLHIRLPFLKAIEAGQYQDLPGTTYALGFVRAYADYLGIDSGPLVEQFKHEAAELERRTELHFPEPLPGGRVPGGAIFFVCIILAVIFYGGWMFISSSGKPVLEVVSELPANLAEMIGVEAENQDDAEEVAEVATEETTDESISIAEEVSVENAPASMTEEVDVVVVEAVEEVAEEVAEEATETATIFEEAAEENAPVTEETVAEETEAAAEVVAAISTPDTVEVEAAEEEAVIVEEPVAVEAVGEEVDAGAEEATASVVEEEAEEASAIEMSALDPIPSPPLLPQVERAPRIYGEENTSARVIITANTPTWVEVTAPSGELILTRLLGEKDSFRVPDIAGLTLVTGNAGGLNFTVDGQAVPDIGPIGSVRRDVLLDPESLKLGPEQ